MSDEDDADAGWAQMQLEERRRREDEALERHRELLRQFECERAEFHQAFEIWSKQLWQAPRHE